MLDSFALKFPEPGDVFELVEDVTWLWPDFRLRQFTGEDHPIIPSGTVIQLGTFNAHRHGYVTLKIIESPDKRLLPKKQGGTGGRVYLYPNVPQLNRLAMKVRQL